MPFKPRTAEQWLTMYEAIPEVGCWIWTGHVTKLGYGRVDLRDTEKRQRFYAHRFLYERLVGPLRPGDCVCHRCDTPSCVNPGHMFIGDRRANMLDMQAKNRGNCARGETNGHAVLTVDAVRSIRQERGTDRELGEKYGVCGPTISRIRRGLRWASV